MKEVSKAQTIVNAFTQKPNVDEETLAYRRKICGSCEFNSDNKPDSELGFIEKARKKLIKGEPFCTACGCQVNEKTGQATEECGLAEKGLSPKWNRVKVETTSRWDLNVVNESQEIVNLRLDEKGSHFEIDFGETKREGVREITFLLQSKIGVPLTMHYVRPSCNICTDYSYVKIDENTVRVTLSLDVTKISVGAFKKSLHLGYYLKQAYKKQTMRLIGILND